MGEEETGAELNSNIIFPDLRFAAIRKQTPVPTLFVLSARSRSFLVFVLLLCPSRSRILRKKSHQSFTTWKVVCGKSKTERLHVLANYMEPQREREREEVGQISSNRRRFLSECRCRGPFDQKLDYFIGFRGFPDFACRVSPRAWQEHWNCMSLRDGYRQQQKKKGRDNQM